jgi:competence protein ComEC
MRRILPVVFTIAVVLLVVRERSLGGDGSVRVTFFDVGQGDAALIVSPAGRQVVVDGGPDDALLAALGRAMPLLDREIELLVLSHPHLDHLAAFPDLLERYRVREVLLTGAAADAPAYRRFLELLPAEGARIRLADPLEDIDLGDGLVLDVLSPEPGLLGVRADPNNTSVVLRAVFGSSSVLFTGDMEGPQEEELLERGTDLRADVLKVAHHGSKTSSSTGILLAVRPRLAVMSYGTGNRYGHPSPAVAARFRALGIPVRATAEEGDICVRLTENSVQDCD